MLLCKHTDHFFLCKNSVFMFYVSFVLLRDNNFVFFLFILLIFKYIYHLPDNSLRVWFSIPSKGISCQYNQCNNIDRHKPKKL